MRRTTRHVAVVIALLLANSMASSDGGQSQKSADSFSSEIVGTWFEQLYDVVKVEKTTPPVASRIYGITAVALYESIVAGTKHHRSLTGQLNGLSSASQPKKNRRYDWPTVANAALADTIRGLYSTISHPSLDAINDLEESFASQQREVVPKRVYERSVHHGQAVAAAILEWAATDGFLSLSNCPYSPVPLPGIWEPTPPAFNPNPLEPCWGMVRPMVLVYGAECAPRRPPLFSTHMRSDFYAAALEVFDVGLNLTDRQKTIADYWSDGPGATGTPPGHWIAIVSQIARNDRLSLATAAEAYARVGIAVHDAFIGCWNLKYFHNLQRPVTYISHIIDANWMTYIVTPNFPSYPSGHSMQSGAAARVLTDMFGIKRFTDTTHIDHGLVPPQEPRRFRSFDQAAAEAAISRLYGGIHYSFDNDDGLTAGQCIAQTIHDRVRFNDRDDDHDRNDGDERRDENER